MNDQTDPIGAAAKPYKGPESYQVEDAELFFGRDDETDQVIARILASRFTLLHAQSGAGKTSLLNARIIPGLETRGWNAFRILPQNDPIESIRAATFQYILPSPASEQFAIERAWRNLAPGNDALTLEELLSLYDCLDISNPLRRTLVRQVKLAVRSDRKVPELAISDPYFCRLLRSCIEVDVLEEHVAAVIQALQTTSSPKTTITSGTRIRELMDIFGDEAFISSHDKLLNELRVPGRDLRVFFEHLVETYGRHRTRFGLVVILDQFEEVFTRFIDPGATGSEKLGELPDWKLRWELFKQLQNLCSREISSLASPIGAAVADEKTSLPIRYVISMRDEYIAQLDPISRFVVGWEDASYHLKLLDKQ
ncbi:MAG TPA: hypothetical protein VHQ64_00025, partial [Pyrinomonadaceae bacterium]|nr:hypothetical protein [Pyrinomonadaceae bacterium]